MPVKRGDIVLLAWQDKTYNAIVRETNSVNADFLGTKGEPAVHLAVLFDEPMLNGKPKPLPIGELPHVTELCDVVHESHEFNEEFVKLHGADAHRHRGAGEWREAVVLEPQALPEGQMQTHMVATFPKTARVVKGSAGK